MRSCPWQISAMKGFVAAPVSDATLPDLGRRRPTRNETKEQAQAIVRGLTAARVCGRHVHTAPVVLGEMMAIIPPGFDA
jgi:hypothetical protein